MAKTTCECAYPPCPKPANVRIHMEYPMRGQIHVDLCLEHAPDQRAALFYDDYGDE